MSGSRAVQEWRQVLREQLPVESRARRRAASVMAAGLFFLGLLAALGLGEIVVLAIVAMLTLGSATGIAWLLLRHRPWRRLPAATRRAGRELGNLRTRAERPAILDTAARAARTASSVFLAWCRRRACELRPALRGLAARASAGRPAVVERARDAARTRVPHVVAASLRRGRELRPALARLAAEARPPSFARPEPGTSDRRRQAVQLNADGARLRREGAYEQAAGQHQAALEIFRALGDRHAEALTLNNVALAQARTGDEETAVAHFEEARVILRELAAHDHEAQVTANLGITLLRHGHDDRAKELLEKALENLDPGSAAARQVEGQLRRAS